MADSSVQLAVENWVRTTELPRLYSQRFTERRLPLGWGALFEYDCVSTDERIVAVVSTSKLMTIGGKQGSGKKHKILLDLAFLFGTDCDIRPGIFTEECMWKWA